MSNFGLYYNLFTIHFCFILATSSPELPRSSLLDINSPVPQNDGSYKIDKILYYPRKKLGEGSMGTTVFLGKYGRREVAVNVCEWL